MRLVEFSSGEEEEIFDCRDAFVVDDVVVELVAIDIVELTTEFDAEIGDVGAKKTRKFLRFFLFESNLLSESLGMFG